MAIGHMVAVPRYRRYVLICVRPDGRVHPECVAFEDHEHAVREMENSADICDGTHTVVSVFADLPDKRFVSLHCED